MVTRGRESRLSSLRVEVEAELARLLESERRARVRAAKLQEIVAALSRASTATDVAESACRIAGELMEARAGALWLSVDDGSLELAGGWGTPREFIEQFRVLRVGTPGVPALEVVKTREPLWIESDEDYRRFGPAVYDRARASGRIAAYGALPLICDDRILGVIVLSHPIGHIYAPDDRDFYVAVALHCSHALERASLLDASRAARAEAERANRLKDEFLATFSHELRTPLHAIGAWASRLGDSLDDRATLERGLGVIRRTASIQARLIDDILDVSRIAGEGIRIEPRAIDLCAVVRDAIEVVRPDIEAKKLRLDVLLPARAPIQGDPHRLQQAIGNLLANAAKFTDAGDIQITVSFDRDVATLTVTDSGLGIDPEFMPHLFERFRQADSSSTRRFGGLGLGLAIARHLVELHGGRIRASSGGLGRGARFEVELPASSATEAAIPPAMQPRIIDLHGGRVMLVDDEHSARDLLGEVLVERGAVVETAASVADAIAVFDRFGPHVIVSDLGMPREDGYSLLRRVRALPGGDWPYAIALTAYASSEERDRTRKAGFDAHAAKPIDLDALLAMIDDGLAQAMARRCR
jgi:signal transduction histidine kinase/CheY-like chemotaxis protein